MTETRPSADDPLEDLVAECLEGDAAANSAALERACAKHPEHAPELRRRVEALARLGIGEPRPKDDFPGQLGEFELLERLGGGGMGVVFRARQASLGRDVALKVIRPEQLFFPRARERFRREAEAVARLQHPGIVPIYSVGEERGVPYFAMELVPGCTMAEILSQLQGRAPERLSGGDAAAVLRERAQQRGEPTPEVERLSGPWIEVCLRWTIEIAHALEHAHQRGVLHRDVKPSNVVITFDGAARLVDFGLASMGQEGAARLTASGAALGSMLYMSPEQLRGDSNAASVRSDVYALGVTLYELLSLQAPYRDTSLIEVREAILQGRADGLRARNRAVSRDLETVCLKAMESSPVRRYASAGDFADDLRNVLELRPIRARPPSTWSNIARWVQRNPAASVALGLGLATAVGVPSALLWQERAYAEEIRGALDDALAARKDADEQRVAAQAAESAAALERDRALVAEAEASKQRDQAQREAVKAAKVSELLTEIMTSAGPAIAQGRELTARELLDAGVVRIEEELVDEPEVLAELLDAIGSCYSSLSEYQKAESALSKALELRLAIHGERSLQVADSHFGLAHLWRVVGDKRALDSARKARALQQELAPDDLPLAIEYLVCVAVSATTDAERPLALASIEQARELLLRSPDASLQSRRNVFANYANLLYRNQRYQESVAAARESLAVERELGGKPHPGLASALNALALSLKHLGQRQESLEAYDELIEVATVLYGERNDKTATFVMNKAALLEELDRDDEALASLVAARAVFDETVPISHPHRITAYGNLGGLYTRSGRWEEGREALEIIAPQMAEILGPRHARTALAEHYLGLCREGVGDDRGATLALESALETTQGNYGDKDPRVARIRASLAAVLARNGAEDARALELAEAALGVSRGRASYTTVTAAAALAVARVRQRRGELEQAKAALEECVVAARIARPDHWSGFAAQIELALLDLGPAAQRRESGELAFGELIAAVGPTHSETAHSRARLDQLR